MQVTFYNSDCCVCSGQQLALNGRAGSHQICTTNVVPKCDSLSSPGSLGRMGSSMRRREFVTLLGGACRPTGAGAEVADTAVVRRSAGDKHELRQHLTTFGQVLRRQGEREVRPR